MWTTPYLDKKFVVNYAFSLINNLLHENKFL